MTIPGLKVSIFEKKIAIFIPYLAYRPLFQLVGGRHAIHFVRTGHIYAAGDY